MMEKRPLKLALYGYYGVGEYCDDYMADATKQTFEEVSEQRIEWVHHNDKDADMIILGGGSLLGENLYLDLLCALLKERDCPFAIFGTGVRDVDRGEFIPKLQYLFQRASSISVRGETSVERLKSWGIDTARIDTIGDPIFLSAPLELESKNYIGGVIRPTSHGYADWMRRSLGFLQTKLLLPVQLFSFCEAQHDGSANKFSGFDSYVLDAQQTRRGIAESAFWFGNRLHAFCLALIEGIPSIGVEIEFRKVEDVCSTIDYPYWLYPGQSVESMHRQLSERWNDNKDYWQKTILLTAYHLTCQAEEILEIIKDA